MDSRYFPLLISSLILFGFAFYERNKEQKQLKYPIVLGSLGLLYILLMSLNYHLMAVVVGVATLVIVIISFFR